MEDVLHKLVVNLKLTFEIFGKVSGGKSWLEVDVTFSLFFLLRTIRHIHCVRTHKLPFQNGSMMYLQNLCLKFL